MAEERRRYIEAWLESAKLALHDGTSPGEDERWVVVAKPRLEFGGRTASEDPHIDCSALRPVAECKAPEARPAMPSESATHHVVDACTGGGREQETVATNLASMAFGSVVASRVGKSSCLVVLLLGLCGLQVYDRAPVNDGCIDHEDSRVVAGGEESIMLVAAELLPGELLYISAAYSDYCVNNHNNNTGFGLVKGAMAGTSAGDVAAEAVAEAALRWWLLCTTCIVLLVGVAFRRSSVRGRGEPVN